MTDTFCYVDPDTGVCYNYVCVCVDCCFFDDCDGFVSTDGERCPGYCDCHTCLNHDCPCQTDIQKWFQKEGAKEKENCGNLADRGKA